MNPAPGYTALVDLATRTLPPRGNVLDIGGPAIPSPRLSSRRVTTVPADEAIAFLSAHEADPFDGILAFSPTRSCALIPLLTAMHDALDPAGLAIVSDVVWQTAPTPELLQSFAPAAGREKVRPIEGYEMQIDHAGFVVKQRVDLPREAWVHALPSAQHAAVAADTRGAAKLAAWILARADDS